MVHAQRVKQEALTLAHLCVEWKQANSAAGFVLGRDNSVKSGKAEQASSSQEQSWHKAQDEDTTWEQTYETIVNNVTHLRNHCK